MKKEEQHRIFWDTVACSKAMIASIKLRSGIYCGMTWPLIGCDRQVLAAIDGMTSDWLQYTGWLVIGCDRWDDQWLAAITRDDQWLAAIQGMTSDWLRYTGWPVIGCDRRDYQWLMGEGVGGGGGVLGICTPTLCLWLNLDTEPSQSCSHPKTTTSSIPLIIPPDPVLYLLVVLVPFVSEIYRTYIFCLHYQKWDITVQLALCFEDVLSEP